MNEQQDDYKYMADVIANQANHIREQQEHIDALLNLVEVYRRYVDYPMNHDGLTLLDVGNAEKQYEETIKR